MSETIDKMKADIAAAHDYNMGLMSDLDDKDSYCDLTFPFKSADETTKYRPPTASTKVDVAASQVITDIPTIDIPVPNEPTSKLERDRDTLLLAANTFFDVSERMNRIPPLREVAIYMMRYGAAGAEFVYDPDIEDEGGFPSFIRALNPKNGYPWGKAFIRRYSKTITDLERTVDEWESNNKEEKRITSWRKKSTDKGDERKEWIEIWYPDMRSIFIGDGKEVDTFLTDDYIENPYGFVPFVYKFSGLAATPDDGKPEKMARGIIDTARQALRSEAFLYTVLFDGVANDVYDRQVVDQDTYEKTNWGRSRGLGEPDVVPNGTTQNNMWSRKANRVTSDFFALLPMIRTDIDQNTLLDNIGGDKVPGVGSGTYNAQLTGQGKLKLRATKHQCELMVEDLILMMLKCGKKHGPWDINSRDRIKPDQIRFPMSLHVSLEPQDIERDDNRIKLGLAALAQKAIPWVVFYEQFARLKNTSGARRQMLIDRIMEDPTIIQAFGVAAAQEWQIAEMIGSIDQRAQANSKMSAIDNTRPALERSKIIPQGQVGELNTPDVYNAYGKLPVNMAQRGVE